MKIWRIWQDENNDYDTYDSAIVAAETEEDAKNIVPSVGWGENHGWCNDASQVSAELVGEATPDIVAGVILASFNAGSGMSKADRPGYYVVQFDEQTSEERTWLNCETVAELRVSGGFMVGKRRWFVCGSEEDEGEPFRVIRRIHVKGPK